MKKTILLAGLLLLTSGCSTMNNTQAGALGGSIFGGVLGTMVGIATGHPLAGAAIGAGSGGLIGGAIGNQEDREELRQARATAHAVQHPPLSLEDIVRMSQNPQISDEVIIQQINVTGSVYQLSTGDIEFLKQNRVSDRVLLYMQSRRPGIVHVHPSRPVVLVETMPPPPPIINSYIDIVISVVKMGILRNLVKISFFYFSARTAVTQRAFMGLCSCRRRSLYRTGGIIFLALATLTGATCSSPSTPHSQGSKVKNLATVTAVPGSGVNILPTNHFGPDEQTWTLLSLIKKMRNTEGLKLGWSDFSASCAARHNHEMVAYDFFGLVSLDGIDLFERLADTIALNPTFTPTQAQYFVVQGAESATELFDFLLENPTTNRCLRRRAWDKMGAAYDPYKGGTWTIVFTDD
jgi:hypothetical protein